MSNIFCVTSFESIGCTFLDWSIHWLSGSEKFYNVVGSEWIDLVRSPLGATNAHNHRKNHPNGFVNTSKIISHLKSIDTDGLLSLYPTPMHLEDAGSALMIPPDEMIQDGCLQDMIDYASKDYALMWDYMYNNDVKLVYVKFNSSPIYFSNLRVLEKRFLKPGGYNSQTEAHNDFLDMFFKDCSDKFDLSNTWEKREFIALNMRPYDRFILDNHINLSSPHFYIDAMDLFFNGDYIIPKVMDFLGIEINNNRLELWGPIYHQWRSIQAKLMRFAWNIDHICDCIINNKNYNIQDYNLSLWQEAIIQHIMIFKHGLNFKNWQLEKFPPNTQELHELLEPNTVHSVKDIYNLKGQK